MARRRLLLVADSLVGTPAERWVDAVVERLSRRHFDLRVASLFDPAEIAETFQRAKVPCYALELSGAGELRRAATRLRKLVKSYRIDILHALMPHAAAAAYVAAAGKAALVTTVFDPREHAAVELSLDLRLRRLFTRWHNEAPPRYLAVSEHVRERCVRELGLDRVEVVTDLHDVEGIAERVAAVDRERARQGLGVRPEDVAILHIGRIDADGGQGVLLDALKTALVERDDLKLLVAGTGPGLSDLRVRAQELDLSDRVLFLGREGDPIDLYAMADLFVLPSVREPHPDGLVDAMAAGLPVVASEVDAVPEVVSDAEAVLTPPGRSDPLARALLDLAGDAGVRERMGRAARRRAADFGVSGGVGRLQELYRSL